MVGIEWTGGLALGDLGFNFCNRFDARYAGHPGERYGVRDYHHGQKEEGGHAGQLGGARWIEHDLVDVETWWIVCPVLETVKSEDQSSL